MACHNGGMEIRSQQTYAASPEQVYAMMTDEAYLAACCDRFGATERTITVEGNRSSVKMGMPAPQQVRTFVGDTLPLNQEIVWGPPAADGTREGTLHMTVDRMPVTVKGTALLSPADQGTQVTYDAEMNVKIPLLGKKLEKEAGPVVMRALDAQQGVGEEYLANR